MTSLLGTWVGPDEYLTEVEYSVQESNGRIEISAVDPSDGECARVSNTVLHSDSVLSFDALWQSSGRIAHCVLTLEPNGEVDLTFTYTDHARLQRKKAS